MAAVEEKYRQIRIREKTDEEKAAKEAEREARKAEREAEKQAMRDRAEADRLYIEEEKRKEKEERLSKMTPDKRLAYDAKVERMKKAHELRKKRTTEVDPNYM